MGHIVGSYIVAFDMEHDDEKDKTEGVVLVGVKQLGDIKHRKPVVINAFQGNEAMEIYRKLTTQKKEEEK